eukprot:TRINITY_DN10861_c0_g1_i1.p1 TRINITY_DN10861_c0_g1~~TRINITY_DN10861_c0_g1_i1.p1  ORF type:complete len:308 (+),score=21.34 TRINITY_DN10861_c0_g1_i1:69-992(+)
MAMILPVDCWVEILNRLRPRDFVRLARVCHICHDASIIATPYQELALYLLNGRKGADRGVWRLDNGQWQFAFQLPDTTTLLQRVSSTPSTIYCVSRTEVYSIQPDITCTWTSVQKRRATAWQCFGAAVCGDYLVTTDGATGGTSTITNLRGRGGRRSVHLDVDSENTRHLCVSDGKVHCLNAHTIFTLDDVRTSDQWVRKQYHTPGCCNALCVCVLGEWIYVVDYYHLFRRYNPVRDVTEELPGRGTVRHYTARLIPASMTAYGGHCIVLVEESGAVWTFDVELLEWSRRKKWDVPFLLAGHAVVAV